MRIHSFNAKLGYWLVAFLVTVGVFVIAALRSYFLADALAAVLFVAASIAAARSFRAPVRVAQHAPGGNSPQPPGSGSLWAFYPWYPALPTWLRTQGIGLAAFRSCSSAWRSCIRHPGCAAGPLAALRPDDLTNGQSAVPREGSRFVSPVGVHPTGRQGYRTITVAPATASR